MKKISMVFILLLLSVLYAVSAHVTFGAQDYNINGNIQGEYYIDIMLAQSFCGLCVYGNYRNEMNLSRIQPLRFAPTQDYYTVGASYAFPFATIRLEHMCMHPVVSQSAWSGLQGGYTRFEIQLGD